MASCFFVESQGKQGVCIEAKSHFSKMTFTRSQEGRMIRS